ncbi:MAG: hypothetical protein WBF04_14080 [Candidatus Sulfotelmatobacter sp.]
MSWNCPALSPEGWWFVGRQACLRDSFREGFVACFPFAVTAALAARAPRSALRRRRQLLEEKKPKQCAYSTGA